MSLFSSSKSAKANCVVSEFIWNINHSVVASFKSTAFEQSVESDAFDMFGAKWNLICYPKGDRESSKEYVDVFLYCETLPIGMTKFEVTFKLEVNDEDKNYWKGEERKVQFSEALAGRGLSTITFQQLESMKSVGIRCTMTCTVDHLNTVINHLLCKISEHERKDEEMQQQIITTRCENAKLIQKLKHEESSKIYTLRKIVNGDDVEIECKMDINKGINFKEYENMLNHHEKVMKEWNDNTKKLQNITTNIQQNNDFSIIGHNNNDTDNNIDSSHNDLYTTFILGEQIINEQSKRLNNIGTEDHIKQLMQTQNKLSGQINTNQSRLVQSEEENTSLNEQYITTTQKRIDLVKMIENNVSECNDVIEKENNLLSQTKNEQHLMGLLKEQQQKLQLSSQKCISLMRSYNVFEESNTKYIRAVRKYFKQKWTGFESEWWRWNSIDIISWFKYKTIGIDTNSIQWNKVKEEIEKRNINGASLQHFNESRLDMIGIHDFKITVCLMQQIVTLRNKYTIKDNIDSNDDCKDNENQIPSKFLCPITKQIMKDPVIAFDQHSYERAAILKYLKQHRKSPITGQEAFMVDVFSNNQLKKEIEAYCTLNNIINNEGDASNDENDTLFIE